MIKAVRNTLTEEEEHRSRHIKLHNALDELVVDWCIHTGKRSSQGTIMDLLLWSYHQTLQPTEPSK